MIKILPLTHLSLAEVERVFGCYTSNEAYRVEYEDSETETSFQVRLVPLEEPHVGRYDHVDEVLLRSYHEVFQGGFSFGAYKGDQLVGVIIAERREWNNSLWVCEFHVAADHRGQSIGRRLMEQAAEKSRAAGLRTIVCETQNNNVPAIRAYRKLGFQMEGIDISYYTNNDYPDRDIAVFMKRRL